MSYSRREFGKLALAGLPVAFAARAESILAALGQSKPDSRVGGVQLGCITYSYRSMRDQSAEATLRYILDSGISAVELMDGPAESFAGAPPPLQRPERRRTREHAGPPTGTWNGEACWLEPSDTRRRTPTPEEEEHARRMRAWRTSASMEKFSELRRMFNDAGVTIYAYKSDGMPKNMQTTDGEFDYLFNVAKTLGATHTTMELPTGAEAEAMLKRMAQFAEKHKLAVAYHTHTQGSMTAFDQAFAISPWNKSNVDLGHYVAGGNMGGTTLQFLEKHHDRIASVHLKDRTTPEHCALNLPFGTGETPVKDILQTIKKNKWKFPVSIELEYPIPEGSDPVQEMKKCVDYCRKALA
jgi:sugar phosphate isomerase/epimerase